MSLTHTIGQRASDDATGAAPRDAAAFRAVVERHAPALHRTAYRMIADAAEAEDIAQEALLRLWRRAAQGPWAGAPIGPWLSRVTINLCFDRLRRRRFVSTDAPPDIADGAIPADAGIDAERLRAATIACIQALPARQRAAIVLTYYEEQPNQMAADAMEMNIKAFESLLARARHALRSAFAARGLIDPSGGAA